MDMGIILGAVVVIVGVVIIGFCTIVAGINIIEY